MLTLPYARPPHWQMSTEGFTETDWQYINEFGH
jgi:hypothetical protein